MANKVKGFVTHQWPHLDELAAIWALCKWGKEIGDPHIAYWKFGEKAEDWQAQGYVVIGVGGSNLDEHPANGQSRVEGDCSFTRTLKELGIDDNPSLQAMVKPIANEDGHAGLGLLGIPSGVKVIHQMYPEDPFAAYVWAATWLDAEYQRQMAFHGADFDSRTEWQEIPFNGKSLKLAVISCEGPIRAELAQLGAVARSRGANIIIQRWGAEEEFGHVQVFTRKHPVIGLRDVVRMLRVEELRHHDKQNVMEWRILEASGSVDGIPEWYYQIAGQMLLNGSLTAREVPPTHIPLAKIVQIVRVGVNPGAMHGDCVPSSGCNGKNCPWYGWGLFRCRDIRRIAHKKKLGR